MQIFLGAEFKQNTKSIDIEIKEIPVEVYYNISKIKYYHMLLGRAYDILIKKLLDIDRNILL
jgi:hypothetical protein